MDNKRKFLYLSIIFDEDNDNMTYYYWTDENNVSVNDKVLVDRNGNYTYGTVISFNLYDKNNVPYPLEKTKKVIKVFHNSKQMLSDYFNLLLNNMFGKISIKRLMNLCIKRKEDKLFYYSRFNTFFYKDKEGNYTLAEYNTNLITKEMFELIEKESIEIPNFKDLTLEKAYVKVVIFCQENSLPFHDDTDNLEYIQEKKLVYKDRDFNYKEPKPFNSTKEIKEYLNEYVPAKWLSQNPGYYIDNYKIVHYFNYLNYDERIFKILNFLEQNHYIDSKYYDKNKYPEFWQEDFKSYNYNNLDYPRVCYSLYSIFRAEKFCDGVVNEMAQSGILLKLVERCEYFKNKQ